MDTIDTLPHEQFYLICEKHFGIVYPDPSMVDLDPPNKVDSYQIDIVAALVRFDVHKPY